MSEPRSAGFAARSGVRPRQVAVVDGPERDAVVVDGLDVCRSENTWKPPESVRIGLSQPMKE